MGLGEIAYVLRRRKVLDGASVTDSQLPRCLKIGDLTALGVGSTLGVGIYVLAGHVARDIAGPSVIISFFLAAIASAFAGLCYAEFGARVPRAGSAYIYSYVCVGEFVAFIIGWNLILEYAIGSASVSRGISLYIDFLLNNTLKETFESVAPIKVSYMSHYFDFFAFFLVICIGCGLAVGLKQSSVVNKVFTVLNICIVVFIIIAGSFKANIDNWNIPYNNVTNIPNDGHGGFFPFGFSGTLKGAATCFFGFVGFDCIATTGEEVKNPKKSIPFAIILSLGIVFLSYFGIAAITTLILPYYLQDINAPLPFAFHHIGWDWAKWIVSIGGIFGLLASLFGAMFPLPRILYAMASDGLIFRFLGNVSTRYKSPVIGTLTASVLTGTMASMFELQHLISMMSIGTLMAYTVVAACILVLRYEFDDKDNCDSDELHLLPESFVKELSTSHSHKYVSLLDTNVKYESEMQINDDIIGSNENINIAYKKTKYSSKDFFDQLLNRRRECTPSKLSSMLINILILIYCLFTLAFVLCIVYMKDSLMNKTVWSVMITSIFGICMLLTLIFAYMQPQSDVDLSFQVPLVPLIPFLSIFINIYLMLMLDINTWIRFGIWMAIGIPIYLLSLYIYDRGPNYINNVQKSSLNGHMKGNLNYAFEEMVQCQENESLHEDIRKIHDEELNIFEPIVERDVKVLNSAVIESVAEIHFEIIENKRESKLDEIIKKSDVIETSINYANLNSDLEINNAEKLFDHNKEIEKVDSEPVKSNDTVSENICETVDNKLSSELCGEEIIEFLDQVLKDAESDTDINETFNTNSDQSITDEPNSQNILQNVVAIVHQEDTKSLTTVNEEDKLKDVLLLKEDFFIPTPPPIDEEYFKSHSLYIKSPKSPKFNTENRIKSTRKRSLDESVVDKMSRPELIAKLNHLFGDKTKLSNLLRRGVSVDPKVFKQNEVYGTYTGIHRSEPDLKTVLNNENDANIKIVSIPIDEPQKVNSEDNQPEQSTIPKDTENNPENQDKNETILIDDKSQDNPEESLSKDDIKKKLESIFAKSPTPEKSKILISSREESTSPESETSAEIKPKKINLTNTMKLQRARYEDVLKSFQEVRNIGDIDDDAGHNILVQRAKSSASNYEKLADKFSNR